MADIVSGGALRLLDDEEEEKAAEAAAEADNVQNIIADGIAASRNRREKLIYSSYCVRQGARDNEQREKIEAQSSSEVLPPLAYLPSRYWWKLFIESDEHSSALESGKGGMIYDYDKSPGYYASLMLTLDRYLLPTSEETPYILDALKYNGLFYVVTRFYHNVTSSRLRSEILHIYREHEGHIFGSLCHPEKYPAAWAEVSNKIVGGKYLISRDSEKESRPSVCVLEDIQKKYRTISTNYFMGDRDELIESIFSSHYDSIGKATHIYDKVKIIADTVRTLHILHPFKDGNGRLNMPVVLNILLTEQGLVPTILPKEMGIFDGRATIYELAKNIVWGMRTFAEEVEKICNRELPEKYLERIEELERCSGASRRWAEFVKGRAAPAVASSQQSR